jgi:hypothetical protein
VNGDAHVARLLVQGAGRDPIVERLRAERIVASLDLRPRSLPREAILCVRELRDPLPGALSLSGRGPPARWPMAMQRELDRIAAAAAWPARGAVRETAEAVAFADEPELLECLASDLLRGLLGQWWWELLAPRHPDRRAAVAARFHQAAHAVPAAVARLGARGAAGAFVRALRPAEVRAIAVAVAERFALPLATAVLAEPAESRQPVIAASVPPRAAPRAWTGIVREANDDAASRPELRAFVAVLLALARAPAVARSEWFARETLAFVAHQQSRSGRLDEARALAITRAARPRQPEPPPQPPSARTERTEAKAVSEAPSTEARREPAEPLATAPEPATPPPPTALPEPASDPVQLWPRALDEPPPQKQDRARGDFAQGIHTRFGGLFYLLTLALHLSPLPLGPWDFVACAGRRLLLLRPIPWAPIDDDPIWPLLEELRGPRTDLAFTGWTLPYRWTADALYDGPRVPEEPALDAWLDCVVPFLEHRLRLAVGPIDDVASFVLRHEARVHASETEVDVVLCLSDLPIDIRLAGLDRDPGWVPSAGRKIALHFE